MTVLRPFFKRYGSKWSLSRKLAPPEYSTIIEPFAGGAGYACRYGAGKRVVLIDADPIVADIWRWLLAATPTDVLALPVDFGRTDIRELGIPEAPMRLIQAWLTANASPYTWRFATSSLAFVLKVPGSLWSARTRARVASQLEHIKLWTCAQGVYSCAPDISATWAIDPPYQFQSQHNTQYGARVTDYNALSRWCRSREGQVIVHEQHGADWLDFKSLDTTARTSFNKADGKLKTAHEVVWSST